ncbi:MAG: hypothetical protein ACM34I_00535 [bacterium]
MYCSVHGRCPSGKPFRSVFGKMGITVILVFIAVVGLISASHSEVQAAIRCGIWCPYVSEQGVPPLSSFTARGIEASFITGNIDADALSAYDVIFFGRSGMIGNFPPCPGVITDIDALISWVESGGGIIGESNAFIYDSNAWRGVDWSSRLSVVAGVSGPPVGYDYGTGDLPVTISLLDHPVADGVAPYFILAGSHAHAWDAVLDTTKNPSAVAVAVVGDGYMDAPIIAAEYGRGRSVYFPTALGLGFIDWSVNPDYEKLFLNAVVWAAHGDVIAVQIDIKPGSDPNCFNNNGSGVIPVAILGSPDIDIYQINPESISLEGLAVRAVGKSNKLLAHYEDVNFDGYQDLVVQIEDSDRVFSQGTSSAKLTGTLYDQTRIEGIDSICIVP